MNTDSNEALTPTRPDCRKLVGQKRNRSGDSGDGEVHPEIQCFDLEVYLGDMKNYRYHVRYNTT